MASWTYIYSNYFWCIPYFKKLIFLKDFTYFFERERVSEHKQGRNRRRGRKRIHAEGGARGGALSQNPEIMTWEEDSRLTTWATRCPRNWISSIAFAHPLQSHHRNKSTFFFNILKKTDHSPHLLKCICNLLTYLLLELLSCWLL